MSKPNPATEAQIRAADPGLSTWLSANAGSGKTSVLIDRVARLLLQDVPPDRILCLTYTKAAATEMQNRLFERLGGWAMLDDEALSRGLDRLGVNHMTNTPALRKKARTLFARAIETPGGLKIQTIHSFCSALLRRFPLEAGVAPAFTEMDNRTAKRLRADLLDKMANGAGLDAFDAIAAYLTEDGIEALVQTVSSHREALRTPFDRTACLTALGANGNLTQESLLATVFEGFETDLLRSVAEKMALGTSTDIKGAASLTQMLTEPLGIGSLKTLENLLLFGPKTKQPYKAKIDRFPTRATQEKLGADLSRLNALMVRVEQARPLRLALDVTDKTEALYQFAHVFLPELAHQKTLNGTLDFDDLILKARALLTDPSVAQWVLFRLDGGIDHILVDEAQDTSPVQWDIVQMLAREFASGQGARTEVARTIFVVGDPKQSIYSFQGADPQGFDDMRDYFADALTHADQPFQSRELLFSFRSSSAILRAVDAVFGTIPHIGFKDRSEHTAFFRDLPGRVDLWPVIEKADQPKESAFEDPVDAPSPGKPDLILARNIVSEIAEIIESGTQITDAKGNTRRLTPGDFLVLVQRRSDMFHEIIRACKEQGLPIAGADRLRIGGELAVKDLIALLRFAATPEDSLSLACLLRSPLLGWTEADLYALAHHRQQKYLWSELRDHAEIYPKTVAFLKDIRDQADFLRPFELLDRCLTRHGGRTKLLARLGQEAEDGIDALLAQSMIYERGNVPSLTGFLSWFGDDRSDLKRPIDSTADAVRVMSVHGAKGLEAPVVILPDCAKRRLPNETGLIQINRGPLVWPVAKANAPPMLVDALEDRAAKQEAERIRLLYVAMTRARNWLIIAGAGDVGDSGDSWYTRVRSGLIHVGAGPLKTRLGSGLRYQIGTWPDTATGTGESVKVDKTAVPLWAHEHATVPAASERPLAPSHLSGDKTIHGPNADFDHNFAKDRGTQIHLLLENLPKCPRTRWEKIAQDQGIHEDTFTEALKVIEAHPDLFDDPNWLTEVDITAALPPFAGRKILGAIDRLLVSDTHVLAIDYKSNADVPETPEQTPDGLLRQMGAYASALGEIYPNHEIDTAILWTRTAHLMHLPHDLVIQALQNTALA